MKRMNVYLVLIAVLMLSGMTYGQYGGRQGNCSPRGGCDGGFREKAENFENLRLLKMLDVLDLNEKQSDSFIALFHTYRREIKNLRIKRAGLIDSLHQLLKMENNERDIEKLIDEIQQNSIRQNDAVSAFFEKCQKILDVRQVGKLVLFHERFERDIIKSLWKLRRGEMPPLKKEILNDGK